MTAHPLPVHSFWTHAFRSVGSRAWLATVMLAALALAGCGGSSSGSDAAGPVASIVVSPGAPELSVGSSVQLTAAVLDGSGKTLTGLAVTWSSQDATILAVNASGLVTAHQPGSTRITASAGGKTGFAQPLVSQPVPVPVATVVVSPASDVLEEGASQQFTAVVYDANDNVLTGRGITWTSQDGEIAHVDPGGVVTALRPGLTTITAKVEGRSDTAAIRVAAHYPFELLYRRSAEGGAADLHTLDINDPAAVAMPVLLDGLVAMQPVASPDGSRIAFVVPASPGTANWPGTAIYTARRDGSDLQLLIADGQVNEQPAWSPDGNLIVFRRQASASNSDIWVMNAADGSAAVNLTELHGDTGQSSPAWSPLLGDGSTRIAYVQSDQGQMQIWTMRPDGSDPQRTTFSATADDDQPAWSPDGLKIVFQRSDAAVFGDLYVVNAAGGNGAALRPAAPLAGPQHRPQYSPDGKLIAFASRHEGHFYQIYTVWSDGSRLARRTFDEGHHNVHPAWLRSDDGS